MEFGNVVKCLIKKTMSNLKKLFTSQEHNERLMSVVNLYLGNKKAK